MGLTRILQDEIGVEAKKGRVEPAFLIFLHLLGLGAAMLRKTLKDLIFQDKFAILLKVRLSGIVEQEYTM